MFSLTTGVRYRSSNKTLWGFQYAYGTTGFFIAPLNASHCLSFTGNFDRTTETHVKQAQFNRHLFQDGVAGPATLRALGF